MSRTSVVPLLFFLLLSAAAFSQSRTRRTVTVEKYANGRTKSRTVLKVTTNFYVDLFNYYKKTSLHITLYDSISGKKTKETLRVTKNGMDGRHCYELYVEEILYDAQGKKSSDLETWCDKGERLLKEYEHGKLVYTHLEKRRPVRKKND